MAAASALPCINHSVPEGVVNLIQVAGVATGDSRNAGRDAARAVAVLSLQQKRARVDGKGKEVLVGSYEDALKVAEYLGASDETMDAIRAALQKMPGASGASDESSASDENGVNEDEERARRECANLNLGDKEDEELDVSLLPTQNQIVEFKKSGVVLMTPDVSAWLSYKYHRDARRAVRNAVEEGSLSWGKEVSEVSCGISSLTGREIKHYEFTIEGFKMFCLMCPTSKGRSIRKYFIDSEIVLQKMVPEYNKTREELEKTQQELDEQKKENERLRKEKEIISDYQRWRATREDGIKAHHTAMDNLKHIVQGIEGTGSAKLYAIVNDAINKAVLNFTETTRAFKQAQGYSRSLSVPDILDDLALKERQSIVERFTRYFAEKGDVFRELDLDVVIRRVKKFAEHQKEANAAAGDLKNGHLLTNAEAKRRKRHRENDVRAERIAASNPQPLAITVNGNVTNMTINNAAPVPQQRSIHSFFKPASSAAVVN